MKDKGDCFVKDEERVEFSKLPTS